MALEEDDAFFCLTFDCLGAFAFVGLRLERDARVRSFLGSFFSSDTTDVESFAASRASRATRAAMTS